MKKQYQIYCDMDGVLVDFIGGLLPVMNNALDIISNKTEYYKSEHPKFYKLARKAVEQLGGNLEEGDLGKKIEYSDVQKHSGTPNNRIRNFMYALVSNDYKFWVNLDWTNDGRKLWSYIEKHDPIVLSSPMGEKSKKAKLDWCKKELGLSGDRIILTTEKQEFAINNGVTGILIDDMPKHIKPFQQAGGLIILHSNASSTIQKLQTLGF